MKKAFSLFITSLILLMCMGCEDENQKYIAIYNGEIYDGIWYWYPVNEEWEQISAWIGYENKVSKPIKYSDKAMTLELDKKRLFLADSNFSERIYFFKRGEILPTMPSDDVEKVVLYSEKKSIILENEILELWQDFLKQYRANPNSFETEKWKRGDPKYSIDVYFKEFPMYYHYGNIGLSKSGRWGLSSPDNEDNISNCIVIPENLASRIFGVKK